MKTHKGKRVQCNASQQELVQRVSLPEPCKSLSLHIPLPLTHLSNMAKGRDLVKRSA
jgi:hypothetical protein